MPNSNKAVKNERKLDVPEHLKDVTLITRSQLAALWNIAVSHLDNIPETELERDRIGKSIRFTWDAINSYIKNNKSLRSLQ